MKVLDSAPLALRRLFEGALTTTSVIHATAYATSNDQSFTTVQLPLQAGSEGRATELQACVNAIFLPEHLGSSNGLRCPDSGQRMPTGRSTCCSSAPDVLILQLMRFTSTPSGARKDCRRVDVQNNITFDQSRYRLAASVLHYGAITNGHYVALLTSNDQCTVIDDAVARHVTWAKAHQLLHESYILAYTKL